MAPQATRLPCLSGGGNGGRESLLDSVPAFYNTLIVPTPPGSWPDTPGDFATFVERPGVPSSDLGAGRAQRSLLWELDLWWRGSRPGERDRRWGSQMASQGSPPSSWQEDSGRAGRWSVNLCVDCCQALAIPHTFPHTLRWPGILPASPGALMSRMRGDKISTLKGHLSLAWKCRPRAWGWSQKGLEGFPGILPKPRPRALHTPAKGPGSCRHSQEALS